MQNEGGAATDLAIRTKRYAVRVIRCFSSLAKDPVAQVIGRQFLRSATSVGAQYREARRARSTAEFISKLECALQEADETAFWFELLTEAGIVPMSQLQPLFNETHELIAILAASVNTAKRHRKT